MICKDAIFVPVKISVSLAKKHRIIFLLLNLILRNAEDVNKVVAVTVTFHLITMSKILVQLSVEMDC